MPMKTTAAIALAASLAAAGTARADLVFQDGFEAGLSDWYIAASYDGDTFLQLRSDLVHGGAGAMQVGMDHPSDASVVSNRYVRAVREFTLADSGDYLLDLWALNSACSGCGLSFEVLLDDALVLQQTSVDSYQQVSQLLSGLGAGTHTLALGMFVASAGPGIYSASFDDVTLSTVAGGGSLPEPTSWALVLAALGAGAALRRRMR